MGAVDGSDTCRVATRQFLRVGSLASVLVAAWYIGHGQTGVGVGLIVLAGAATGFRGVLRMPAAIATVVAFLYLPPGIVLIVVVGLAVLAPAVYIHTQGFGHDAG
jgi:hypothetical protein